MKYGGDVDYSASLSLLVVFFSLSLLVLNEYFSRYLFSLSKAPATPDTRTIAIRAYLLG